jgi:hypothetical protein
MALEAGLQQLGELWKALHGGAWRERAPGAHRCSSVCTLECVRGYLHRVPGSGLHPCLLDPCPIARGRIELHVRRECWVCRESGQVHLCGDFCARWEWNADGERTCVLTGHVFGPQWAGERADRVWKPEVPLPATGFWMPRLRRGGVRYAEVDCVPNPWSALVGDPETLHRTMADLARRGWDAHGDRAPKLLRAGLDGLVVRGARVLAHLFAREPWSPFVRRLRAGRERCLSAERAARAALELGTCASAMPEAAFARLARHPAPETWLPTPGSRLGMLWTLLGAVLVFWRACSDGQMQLGRSAPAFEKFALAVLGVLGAGVHASCGDTGFAAVQRDPRVARLPVRETAELMYGPECVRRHDRLVEQLSHAASAAASANPRLLRDVYNPGPALYARREWKDALRAKRARKLDAPASEDADDAAPHDDDDVEWWRQVTELR